MGKGSVPSAARLSDYDILHVWEAGAVQHPVDRALTILAAAESGSKRSELARLPSGRRDERLLAVYQGTFGSCITGLGWCPQCRECVEFSLDTRNMVLASGEVAWEGPLCVKNSGYQVTFRLPDSYDLAEIARLTDVGEARKRLLERCIVQSAREGNEVGLDALPEKVISLLVERMAGSDPMAEVELAMICPSCQAGWPLAFDIESFLWKKIEERAGRLLREVHVLASAYGWREADILTMTVARRQAYLDMIS